MMMAPNNVFQAMGDSKEALLLKIMDNIYHYGRLRWTWTGRGLLDGTITACACGAFASGGHGDHGHVEFPLIN